MSASRLTVDEAAEVLGVEPAGVRALVAAGFLDADGQPTTIALGDLKAFAARNSRDPGGVDLLLDGLLHAGTTDLEAEAEAILDALECSVDRLSRRAARVMASLVNDGGEWDDRERATFEASTRERIETIVALCRAETIDEDVFDELADVGAAVAFADLGLPGLLLSLRVIRDLLVQTAVTAAEERGERWGLALALTLTRILPVMDRLTDAVARGYWEAINRREAEAYLRYEHLVEHAAHGFFEVDLLGFVTYANPPLAAICGVGREEMLDRPLGETLVDPDDEIDPPALAGAGWIDTTVVRADGIERQVTIQVTVRHEGGEAVGYDGIVRDVTAERELERQKNDFLALLTQELRQPLTALAGLGITIETYASELPVARIERIGASIRSQAERLNWLADDLYDVSRLRAQNLSLSTREVLVEPALEAARAMVRDAGDVAISAADGLAVVADARRVEQILAHLIENAIVHGAEPVEVRAEPSTGGVRIAVIDHGPGVDADRVPGLFAGLTPTSDARRQQGRDRGLGLGLARALVEAMGGRISYEAGDATAFVVELPGP